MHPRVAAGLFLVLLLWVPPVVASDTVKIETVTLTAAVADTSESFPSHGQFVRDGYRHAAESLFETFSFSRPMPVWVSPVEGQAASALFESAATHVLFDRGFVVREGPAPDSDDRRLWSVRYRIDREELSLTQSVRRKFLGRIWVERVFEAALYAEAWDLESGELLWTNSLDLTVSDWIPKRRLPRLEQAADPLLSPRAPETTIERLVEPLAVISAVGALTVLFFAVR